MNEQKSYLKPALVGGLVTGFLSWLPGVSIGNCLCCMWVIVGGVLAAYFISEQTKRLFTAGDGAFAGMLSGVVGALVDCMLTAVTWPLFGLRALRRQMEQMHNIPGLPPGFDRFTEHLQSGGGLLLLILLVMLVVSILVFALFGSLGGLLGYAFFATKPQRLQPPPPTPPAA